MIYEQFSKPKGIIGKCVGWFMVQENYMLNEWTLSFLNLEEKNRILEIGFGPGEALKKAAKYEGVELFGIDPSEEMVETTLRRLHKESAPKQICLMHGEANELEKFQQPLDKIYAINNVTFWEEPVRTLSHLRSLLREGGKIALTLCPHEEGADDDTTEVLGGQLRTLLHDAGFQHIEVFIKPTNPNDSVCAVAMN
ncbi:class I SAM-dependent methyltransferase [Halobacillus sp. BBL2006]|uniref:class I SAM-dependent methyltransferase n=1 Tax=Halobacillus sp. BBL2006 TaxID=1543706 RepID=UPI0005437AFB|nr:methyltransferase domain-containing protein [Halobacillus sp. BBL2006]KHE67347.1 methyltransferase [Halobacillus sp. BBL2006]